MSAIRVLVVDDHPTFVRAVTLLLDADDDIEVVGSAAEGATAVALAIELQPDVVLMDLNMPELNGIEATREIVGAVPHVAVIVLTMFDDDQSVSAAIRHGARGYLLKGARQDEIRRAVRAAAAGEAIFGPVVARKLSALLDRPAETGASAFPGLTARELDVLALVAEGADNPSIARALHLSVKTVRNYVSLVLTKIHVATRAEAIVLAREAGLGVGANGSNGAESP
jgi:DNA-binding NarL/FixJ family response regulator